MKLVATGRKLKTVCEMITLVTSKESHRTKQRQLITLAIVLARFRRRFVIVPYQRRLKMLWAISSANKRRADDLMGGVAQPVIGVGGQQQADRQKIQREPKEEKPAHGR